MHKFQSSIFAVLLFTSGALVAQPTPSPTPATPPAMPDTIPALNGVNLVEGKDKKLHFFVDGQRIGSLQVDRAWAEKNAALRPIPPEFWEPKIKIPPKPRDPCIFAGAAGKCVPDFTKQGPLIRFPNDVREIGVLTRK